MRALRLDYCSTQAAAGTGTVLLGIGVAVLMVTVFRVQALEEEVAKWGAKVTETTRLVKQAPADKTRAERGDSAQEVALANDVLRRLALPWDTLFAAIESARSRNVGLLSIEPDAAKSSVRIAAEAKSADDMLEYVRRLQGAAPLSGVTLANHQIKRDDPRQPVRFTLIATWATQP